MDVDVLIVGGGPAGLSAALVLGRCLRSVMICDDGHQRNRASTAIHGLLGQDGKTPQEFLNIARAQLSEYPTVRSRMTKVAEVNSVDDRFQYSCEDGTTGSAAKVLLASGIIDELPAIAGAIQLYGSSVHHCLYCDGFEYVGKRVAAYGKGDKSAELGLMLRHWVSDVVVCSDGVKVNPTLLEKLRDFRIPHRVEAVLKLVGVGGRLSEIHFESGPSLARDALFFATGCHQASPLSERLGCKRDARGGAIIDPATESTSVPGVYVAGDVSRDVLLVSIAIAEGTTAAVAINKALLRRDGLCE